MIKGHSVRGAITTEVAKQCYPRHFIVRWLVSGEYIN